MPSPHRTGDAERTNELRRAADEVTARLEALGVTVNGDESPESLVDVLEEVERFERAVEAQGGDLMMDESPANSVGEPDDPHFALPKRRADETVRAYRDRLARATDEVRRHTP